MSRSIDQENPIRVLEEGRDSKMPLSHGRVNGTGNGEPRSNQRRRKPSANSTAIAGPHARLAEMIDRAAQGQPAMTDFISRLEGSGVAVLPSVQSSGRLNGISYRFQGTTINGSAIGRAYTSTGLQGKKGVRYDPERDQSGVLQAIERGGRRLSTPDRDHAIERTKRDSRGRDRATGLTANQQDALSDIGKFRTVAAADLATHRYAGNANQFDRDLRQLVARGFAERKVITHDRGKKQETVVVLTHAGRKLLRRANSNPNDQEPQQFYFGFVKPSEVPHDIGIYRMYQQEAARIERDGGKIRRVVLDFELKRKVFRDLNKTDVSRTPEDYAKRKEDIANRNGLSVVEGRVVFPDLRVEYETRDQEMEKVDLELATGHYKESQLEAKRAAGLKIYAPDSGLGSPAHHDTEIVSGLLSL